MENGIHTMNMPLTGQYELVLSGWGQGNSAGCKVTMIKSFKQGETIKFFIGSFLGGVFVFDKAYQLIAVAGSAGQSQEEKIRCSGSVALSYTILFSDGFHGQGFSPLYGRPDGCLGLTASGFGLIGPVQP